MYNWFECKVKYEKTGEDGIIKVVSEFYLVDSLSFTECEARITKEMKPFISGEFLADGIKRARISELFPGVDETFDRWYKCKVNFVTLDENKGVEKRVATTMYAKGNDVKTARETLIEGMKTTLADYEITSIVETKILDVFYYEAINN
jgi:hypothetical protein